MKKQFLVLFSAATLFAQALHSQNQGVSINTSGLIANPSAILDISSIEKGILIPRMTVLEKQAISPLGILQKGLLVYDTTDDNFWYWDGTQWVMAIGPMGPAGPIGPQGVTGITGATGAQGPIGPHPTTPTEATTLNVWSTIGNANILPAANFFGTTDNQPVIFKTNNIEKLRITENGNVLINTQNFVAAGDAFTSFVSPTFSTAIAAYGNGGVPIFAEQQNNSNTALIAINSASGGAGIGSAIYAASEQTDGQTISATLQSNIAYSNTCVSAVANVGTASGIIGSSLAATGTGIIGINDAPSGNNIGFGGVFRSGQTGGAALTAGLRTNYFHTNTSISAVTDASINNGRGIIGGCDNNNGVGILGQSSGTHGKGIMGLVSQNDAMGVYGQNGGVNGTGVVGAGSNQGPVLLVNGCGGAFTGLNVGLYGRATGGWNSWGGYFSNASGNYAYVGGDLSGTGYKINGPGVVSTIVSRPDGSKANMFCPESPEILLQDFGSGQLVNGRSEITLDPIFSNNIYVDDNHPLRVFVQLEGNCNGVYVSNKTKDGFEVIELMEGQANVSFTWFASAVRADTKDQNNNITSKHIGVRFPNAPQEQDTKTAEKSLQETPKKHSAFRKKQKNIKS